MTSFEELVYVLVRLIQASGWLALLNCWASVWATDIYVERRDPNDVNELFPFTLGTIIPIIHNQLNWLVYDYLVMNLWCELVKYLCWIVRYCDVQCTNL